MHLNKTPYLKDYNATTLWQNIPSLLNLGIHTNIIMSKMASYRWLQKKRRELNVIIINSSSWPNMSTGDPVVSSEWVFADEGLNTWPNRKTNAFYLY